LGIGGVEDHVHILCTLARTICVADLLRELKRDSTKWIKTRDPHLAAFGWQDGYGAFSFSVSELKGLQEYVNNQESHHRKESFQDEFRRLLKLYGVEYDERYVWD
jgi:REP element-mobilizing transposase RayT